jgi:hypothetical protein
MSVVFASWRVSFVESGARNGAERGVAATGVVHGTGAEAATARVRADVVQAAPLRVEVGVGGAGADAS